MFTKKENSRKTRKLRGKIEPLVQETFNKWKIENGFVDENGEPLEAVFGSCHVYWQIEKKLMKEIYNIEYKTLDEIYPNITFD